MRYRVSRVPLTPALSPTGREGVCAGPRLRKPSPAMRERRGPACSAGRVRVFLSCRRCAIDSGGGKRRTSADARKGKRLPAMEMQDRTVIVTGGASGIGKATALLLAREGARVFVGDIDEAGGQAVAAQAAGERLARRIPAARPDQDRHRSRRSRRRCSSGSSGSTGWSTAPAGTASSRFIENPPEMWDQLIAINLLGAIRLTRAVLPPMIEARAGKIVNISSDAGRVGSTGETVYAAAKGGLIAFTKSLAREMARYRINVNCVCPGPTDTPLFQAQPERMREALTRAIPFRRIAQPEEIAEAVMFFLGRRSDYITGQVLSVSGGLTMVGLSRADRRTREKTDACRVIGPALAAAGVDRRRGVCRLGAVARRTKAPSRTCARASNTNSSCAATRRSAPSGCAGMRADHRPAAAPELPCLVRLRRRRVRPGENWRSAPPSETDALSHEPEQRRERRWPTPPPAMRKSPSTASTSCPRRGGCASPLTATVIADSTAALRVRGDRARAGPLHPGKGRAARSDAADRAQDLLPVQGRLLVLDDRRSRAPAARSRRRTPSGDTGRPMTRRRGLAGHYAFYKTRVDAIEVT